jgi:hypothetical protein
MVFGPQLSYSLQWYEDGIPFSLSLTPTVSQESSTEITSSIEKPDQLASFTAPQVSVKGRDRSGVVQRVLRTGVPGDHTLQLRIERLPPGGAVLFNGYIDTTTIAFDPREGGYTFTAIGFGRLLAVTDASDIQLNGASIKRSVPDDKWSVLGNLSQSSIVLNVQAPGAPTICDFEQGDTIEIIAPTSTAGVAGTGQQLVVTKVTPSVDYGYWTLRCSGTLSGNVAQGSYVRLVTVYRRNVAIEDLVSALFAAAGFQEPVVIQTDVLPNLGQFFLSPIQRTGLPNANLLGLTPSIDYVTPANSGTRLWAQTSAGLYEESAPPDGPWALLDAANKQPGIDPTNYGANLQLFGHRQRFDVTYHDKPPARSDPSFDLFFWAYDYHQTASPFVRWQLKVSQDQSGVAPFPWALELQKQTSTDKYTWANSGGAIAVESGATTTQLDSPLDGLDVISIEVDPSTGVVYFTDMTAGVGTELAFNLSSYEPGVGLHRNIAANRSGRLKISSPGRLALFSSYTVAPTVYVYDLDSHGTAPSLHASAGILSSIVGGSLLKNAGDGHWYALTSDSYTGVQLVSWTDETFATKGGDAQLIAPPPQTPPFRGTASPFDVALTIWKNPATPGGEPFPMYALLGTQPYFLGEQFSGVIAYADTSGLSCADVLQQLATLVAGVYYVDARDVPHFRTRGLPSGTPIGANVQLDDALALVGINTQSAWQNQVLYVRVSNENDDKIFGEAGDPAFANATDVSLILTTRYVAVSSHAGAIAKSIFNYLANPDVYGVPRGLRFIEVPHFDDARDYSLGNTFTATVDDVVRTFQIIETGATPFERKLRVQGVELTA